MTRQVPKPLAHTQLPAKPAALARWLIGKTLVRRLDRALVSGRTVETEAYSPDDPASHAFRGPTPRNGSMYLRAGHAYVYRIYGLHFCLNIAAGAAGFGGAALMRALEPIEGIDIMARRRAGAALRDLTSGPGKLCAALGIGAEEDGLDLCAANGKLWLADGERRGPIGVTTRIGLTKGQDKMLRFFESDNPFVSGPRSLR